MKAFDLKEFNKDGTTFTQLSIDFSSTDGLTIEEKKHKVSVRPQVAPRFGCDFCASGSSMSSENFFEKSGFEEPNDLFFQASYNHKLSEVYLVLDENKDEVIEILKTEYKKWILAELNNQAQKVQKALEAI